MRGSSRLWPRRMSASELARLRALAQPAALWIGVTGALVHIGFMKQPPLEHAVDAAQAAPSAVSSQRYIASVLARCRAAEGARCDADVIDPSRVVETAEEIVLDDATADHVFLRFDPSVSAVVWTVHDFESGTRADFDAHTGELIAFAR